MNRFQKIFDAQKALFASGITRTYEWRVEQLDRMARMIRENERRFQEGMAKDFKTASQEVIFETHFRSHATDHAKVDRITRYMLIYASERPDLTGQGSIGYDASR